MPILNFNTSTQQSESVFIDNAPPSDTSRLWFDTISNQIYCRYKGNWCGVSPIILPLEEIKTLQSTNSYWYFASTSLFPINRNYELLIDRLSITYNSQVRTSANRWDLSIAQYPGLSYLFSGIQLVGKGGWQTITFTPDWSTVGWERLLVAEINAVGTPSWLDMKANLTARCRLIL